MVRCFDLQSMVRFVKLRSNVRFFPLKLIVTYLLEIGVFHAFYLLFHIQEVVLLGFCAFYEGWQSLVTLYFLLTVARKSFSLFLTGNISGTISDGLTDFRNSLSPFCILCLLWRFFCVK